MPIEVLWGVGTVVLLAALAWAVTAYRRSGAAREEEEIKRRSGRVAADVDVGRAERRQP
jgi:hypothetical protein